VQPRRAVFTGPAPALTRGFVQHFREAGEPDVVRQIRAWVREFERGDAQRLQRGYYSGRVEAARRALRHGDRDEAAAIYRELLELPGQPAHREAGVTLAEILAGQGRWAESLEVARRVQREYPADPRGYQLGIDALAKLGRNADACALRRRGALLGALRADAAPGDC
jgi:predicted Zn-dependent protease